jgi:hypothetical protein
VTSFSSILPRRFIATGRAARCSTEGQHGRLPVAADHAAHRGAAGAVLVARLAAGHREARGQSLEVPLEGAAAGLVEVVQVEDEVAVRGGVGAEVEQVGISAHLHLDPAVGKAAHVRGHEPRCAPEERERGDGHLPPADGEQLGAAPGHGGPEPRQEVLAPRPGGELTVLLAGQVLAARPPHRHALDQ